jgi:hypothetical protein
MAWNKEHSTTLAVAPYATTMYSVFSATAGNFIAVIYQNEYDPDPASASVFSDNVNGAYAGVSTTGAYGHKIAWVQATSTGAFNLSWTHGSLPYQQLITIVEFSFSGATSFAVDVEGTGNTLTTSVVNTLAFATYAEYPQSVTAGSGFTMLSGPTAVYAKYHYIQFKELTSSGSNSVQFSGSTTPLLAVAFKAVTGGGGGGITVTNVSPANGFIGATGGSSAQNITITGTNLSGTTPTLTVSPSTGITISNRTTVNSTTWTATVTMTSSATAGTKTLTVTTDDGTATISFIALARAGSIVYIPSSTYGGDVADLKKGAARTIYVRMVDSTDHITPKTGLTLTITASKNGAAFASIAPTVTEMSSGSYPGIYKIDLTAAHTDTAGFLKLYITSSGADSQCPEYDVQDTLDITTMAGNNFGYWFDNNNVALTSRVGQISDPLLTTGLGSYPAGSAGLVLNTIATNAARIPSAPATTANCLTAVQVENAVWDAARSGHTASGSYGQGVASVQGAVVGAVGSVATGGITSNSFASGAINATVLATDAVGASQLATAAVNKIWTTQMTESYAADGTAMTPAQAFFQLWSLMSEPNIGGTVVTCKKLDGTTTSMTFNLNSSTAPTTQTRAS